MASRLESPQTLTFRPMTMADLEMVLENETRSYVYPWPRGIFADCLRSTHECWVLSLGERVIGHGIMSVGAGEGHLLNVCVRRDEQGQGHGRELVIQMLQRALAREVSVVFLEVRPSNFKAIRLYESLGFNEVGRRKGYYPAEKSREDALVLAMQVDADEFSTH